MLALPVLQILYWKVYRPVLVPAATVTAPVLRSKLKPVGRLSTRLRSTVLGVAVSPLIVSLASTLAIARPPAVPSMVTTPSSTAPTSLTGTLTVAVLQEAGLVLMQIW